jgi:hypothetical protein
VGFGAETSIDADAVMENRLRGHRQALIAISIGASTDRRDYAEACAMPARRNVVMRLGTMCIALAILAPFAGARGSGSARRDIGAVLPPPIA